RVGVRGTSDATVELDQLGLASFAALAGDTPVQGTVSGRIALTGTGTAPRATATLRTSDLVVDDIALGALALDATYAEARASVHGAWRELLAEGSGALTGGRLEVVGTGIAYDDIHLRLRANGRTLEVLELHARAGNGTADGEGHLVLAGREPPPVDLRLSLHDF